MPSPVTLETGTMGAPAKLVRSSASVSSSVATSRSSGSTRSILVRATTPAGMPSSAQIARCSRVCGITPSSAATTRIMRSMPPRPASALCTKRSWPGTSTKPSWTSPSTEMREADVDGDAAGALLLPAVAVDAGERLDQRGLAVVDVPRGADHDAAGRKRESEPVCVTDGRQDLAGDAVRPSRRRRRRRSASSSPSSPGRSRSGRRARARRSARGSPGADRPPTPAPAGSARDSSDLAQLLVPELGAIALLELLRRLVTLLDSLAHQPGELVAIGIAPELDRLVLDLGEQHAQCLQPLVVARAQSASLMSRSRSARGEPADAGATMARLYVARCRDLSLRSPSRRSTSIPSARSLR